MENEGWLKRTLDPSDRRRNLIAITAAGRRRLKRLDSVIAEIQDELLAPLTLIQRKRLVHLLTQLVTDRTDNLD